jgi:hypothetical protein
MHYIAIRVHTSVLEIINFCKKNPSLTLPGTMAETNSLPAHLEFSSLKDAAERYTFGDLLGSGVYSEVFEARDQDNGKNKYQYASEVP